MSSLVNTLKLIAMLSTDVYIKQSVLAEKLEISDRQLRRYLTDMKDAHISIESKRGPDGGIRIRSTELLTASVQEFFEEVDSSLIQDRTHTIQSKHLDILKGIIYQNELSDVMFMKYREQIDLSIKELINVKITYKKRSGEITSRTVAPIVMREEFGRYYLIGYDYHRQQVRQYRIDRIKFMEVENKQHTFNKIELMRMLENFGKGFKDESDDVVVRMKIRNNDLHHIKEDLGDVVFDEIDVGTKWTEVSVLIKNLYMFKRFVLREGTSIKVTGPDSLVSDIQNILTETLKLYK